MKIKACENKQVLLYLFALAGGKISLPQIASFMKKNMPEVSTKVSTKTLPDWAVYVVALFNPKAKAIASMLRAQRNVSNAKARKILGWEPIATNEEAIRAA